MTARRGPARRAAPLALAVALVLACSGERPVLVASPEPPPTVAERMLAMLPQGTQVVVEIDLARMRANPVIGEVVKRALAERSGLDAGPLGSLTPGRSELAGVAASPLAAADQVVLAAYGVGTAQAATLTLLAAPHDIAGATRLTDGFYAIGPPDWVDQVQQRVALASTGEGKFALRAPSELLALRRHARPAGASGAALQVTAQLSFDARVSLARQTGLDAAPAQVSAWADVADDFALVLDCDAADPGIQADARHASEAPRRLAAALRGMLAEIAAQPAVRSLGLPSSLAGARLIARGSWVRTIIAVGPAHLRRVVDRATALLGDTGAVTPAGERSP